MKQVRCGARWLPLLLILFFWLIQPPLSAAQSGQTIFYAAYRNLFYEARQQAARAHSGDCRQALNQIAADLESIAAVIMPDGRVMPVDHTQLVAALHTRPCNAARADNLLQGVCPGCGQLLPSAAEGAEGSRPSAALELLAGILSKLNFMPHDGFIDVPDFNSSPSANSPPESPLSPDPGGDSGDFSGQPDGRNGGGGLPNLFDFGWLRNLLEQLGILPASGRSSSSPSIADTPQITPPETTAANQPDAGSASRPLLTNLLLLLLGAGLALVWWRRRYRQMPMAATLAVEIASTPPAQPAAADDYRLALHRLFLAALQRLDEQHLLCYDRTLTNHELTKQTKPPLRDALKPIVSLYDRVWYGLKPINAAQFTETADQIEALADLSSSENNLPEED